MQIAEGLAPFPLSPITPPEIFAAARRLHEEQQLFKQTGGTHAAALLETPVREDSPCFVRENSGRHNALDKAVGAAALQRVRLQQPLLLLTSRLSFELIAKAARAEIGAVAGFSAPTALLSNWRGG